MDSQLLYQQDVTVLEFEAQVVEIFPLHDNRMGVVLDRTYFYPTGGGQEHDTGMIGTAKVVDVYKADENSHLIHVVEGQVSPGQVHAHIDAERRLRNMQHHTAQHLLTQCILRQTGYETVSANINGYSPSTLDIIAPQVDKDALDQAEHMANGIIYEDRPVKTYFVTPDELQAIPLRRPPKVNENIRIVEIDGFDYSPCGGTHVLHTGSIGLLKVLKTEKVNDRQRIYFSAGLQAMDMFHEMYDVITGMAIQLSTAWQDIPAVLSKQADQLGAAQKELQVLHQAGIKYEAAELVSHAELQDGSKVVQAVFEARPVPELRLLADELKKYAEVIAYLASYDGQKVSLVVSCGEKSSQDAKSLLIAVLSQINGRGGGDARLAQGGGAATAEQFRAMLSNYFTQLDDSVIHW
jgi:alanyl-tRNA synthetase